MEKTKATFIMALKTIFPDLKVNELKALTAQDREYFIDALEAHGFEITNRAQAISGATVQS
jgi:GTP cyclohydrolase II